MSTYRRTSLKKPKFKAGDTVLVKWLNDNWHIYTIEKRTKDTYHTKCLKCFHCNPTSVDGHRNLKEIHYINNIDMGELLTDTLKAELL